MPSGIAHLQEHSKPEEGDGAVAKALRPLCTLLYALVRFSDFGLSVPNRARNGRFSERHSAKSLKSLGAGEGNRTLVVSLEGFCSTIELHPRSGPAVRAGGRRPIYHHRRRQVDPARTLGRRALHPSFTLWVARSGA